MSLYSEILSGNGFFMASKALTRRFNLITSAIYGQLASSYESFDEKDLLTVIDGNFYFYLDQEWICNETNLTPYMVRNAVKELQAAGLVVVKRHGMPARNFYHLTDEIDAVMKADKQEQNEKKLARYREREEQKRKKPAAIEESLKQYEAFLNGQQAEPPHVKEARDQKEAQPVPDVENMLPTGMVGDQDQDQVPSIQVAQPPRPAAATKLEKDLEIKSFHDVWRDEKLSWIFDYVDDTQQWTAEFITDICIYLKDRVDLTALSIIDIDGGIYDYFVYSKENFVAKPSRFIGEAIARRMEKRYIKRGINSLELESQLQDASFIENVRGIRPLDPIVISFDEKLAQKRKQYTEA